MATDTRRPMSRTMNRAEFKKYMAPKVGQRNVNALMKQVQAGQILNWHDVTPHHQCVQIIQVKALVQNQATSGFIPTKFYETVTNVYHLTKPWPEPVKEDSTRTLLMGDGEGKPCLVIMDGTPAARLMEYVGIGWVEKRLALPDDYYQYPVVVK